VKTVGAIHHRDGSGRQLDVRIELADRGVVPGLDFADENSGQGGTVEDDLAGLNAVDVDDRHDPGGQGRKLQETVHVEVGDAQRHVGGCEDHLLILDLHDAVAGADRLVGQPDAGFLLIGRSPGRIDRISEGRTRAGDVGRGGRRRRSRNDDAGDERIDACPRLLPMLHGHDPPPAAPAARGRCTVNVAPCPGTLSMVSRPA